MTFKLETKRLTLSDFCQEDIVPYINLTQNEKYQRFYSELDCSAKRAEQLVSMFIEQASEVNRTKFQLAITIKDTLQFIGTGGLRVEDDRQASIGCGLAREFQVSGYAEEAMRALVDYGFLSLNVHRIYAETIGSNKAAIQLCKKFGMRVEARFIEHRYFKEKWWDTVVLAMLKREWKS